MTIDSNVRKIAPLFAVLSMACTPSRAAVSPSSTNESASLARKQARATNTKELSTAKMAVTIVAPTPSKLALRAYTADASSFHVSSVLVTGEKDAVLIDAQFTRADAHRVVAEILSSGKRLRTVYVSHGDPDYYFGLEVVQRAFPEAAILASAPTIEHITKTAQKKLDTWGPKLGANGPKNVILPAQLKGGTLDLEGHKIEVVGLEGESAQRSFVWIPSLRAVVGGIGVYGNLHLWIADAGTSDKRRAWKRQLEAMEALRPEIVVPGHMRSATSFDPSAIRFTAQYLEDYELEFSKAKDSAALIAAMKAKYPDAELPIALELGAKVAKGEMTW